MIEKILIENGFTEKEAKIYLAVLALGEAPVSRVAAHTHLKRTTAYPVVENLKERGILTVTKKRGIQYVSAIAPRILIDRLKQSAQLAEEALPALMQMAYTSPLKPRIRFFEGIEGLKEILREFSYSTEPTMGFTDYEQMPKELLAFIRSTVVPQRIKLSNPVKLIATRNQINLGVQKDDIVHYSEHRLVEFPAGQKNPIEILIYEKSKIAFLSFTKDELFGMIVDSAAIYETMKNIFMLLWQNAQRKDTSGAR
ncbi:MAG: hypothetical protein HOO67_00155 [Candidatus Peribacteraceae bacterium]|nr:hypothetical protein [Candidatus Peribacteraceae bacterium]